MPKEIYPSSYECDCGHQVHFGENTVREIKRMSLRKKVRLAEGDHIVLFYGGKMLDVLCPTRAESYQPEETQEVMSTKGKERLHPRIDRKLAAIVRDATTTPAWQEPWSQLGPESSEVDRLRVCQTVRDSDTLPEDAGYFLVCWATEGLTTAAEENLQDPLQTLNLFETMRTSDRIFADLLDTHGEGQMAALFRTDPEEHARRREAGRLFFFGPMKPDVHEVPGWLDALLRLVADSVVASGPIEKLEYRHRRNHNSSEIHVWRPSAGGWAIEVERLRESFDRVDSCGWFAVPPAGDDSPYFWIEGRFLDRDVSLRVLADAARGTEGVKSCEVWWRTP